MSDIEKQEIAQNDTKGPAFPFQAVENLLRKSLVADVEFQAKLNGSSLPSTESGILTHAVSIDSLATVDIICEAEPIIGCELPESIVKQGGYESIREALDHLMPGIEKIWTKNQKKSVK